MRKKILITGASGFVGFHLVQAAHAKGYEVHAAVRASSSIDDIRPYVDKFVYPSFDDMQSLHHIFKEERYNYVIHAAAMTKAKRESDLETVNVQYTQNLLQAAFESNDLLERFVYVSSLAALGPLSYDTNDVIHEDSPYRPLTAYGRSKQKSEILIKDNFRDKPISIFRPTAVYGPKEKDIFILFNTLNKGLDPYIGRTPQKLSFIYVKDLVEVLLKGLEDPTEGLSFYNISDGNAYSRYAIADIYKSEFRKSLFRVHVPLAVIKAIAHLSHFLYKKSSKTPVIYPERLHELTADNWQCDISLAKDKLGFDPKFYLQDGVRETILWYKANNWL